MRVINEVLGWCRAASVVGLGLFAAPAAAQPAACVAQPCAPCEQPPPVAHHGLLLMGYIGVNTFPGKGALDDSAAGGLTLSVGPGLRVGGLAGWYALPWVSVNGELTVDIVNTDDPGGYWVTGGTRTAIALSPFLHIPVSAGGDVEAAIGPKLGFRWTKISSQSFEVFRANGYIAGVNAGVFVRGGAVMLGGLASFELSKADEICREPDASTMTCTPFVSGASAEKLVSVSGSVLF